MIHRLAVIFVGLLLVGASASAQMLMLNYGGGAGGGGGSSYQGPGDIVSNAQIFLGLRAYSNAIVVAGTHKLINASRSSDSHTCDVIVGSNGGLGQTANCSTGADNGLTANAFCNATTCVVVTIYDQISTHDATQATPANRPTLTFSCLGGGPCMTFGTSQALVEPTTLTFAQPLTLTLAAKRTANFTLQGTLTGSNGTQPEVGGSAVANTWFMYAGVQVNIGTTVSDSVWHTFNFLFTGASSVANVDGTEVTTSPSTAGVNGTIFIGNGNWNGTVTEVGIWPSGFNGTQRTNMCRNIQSYYGGGANFGATC